MPKDYSDAKLGYDIALLLLKTEVKFKNIANIETICLPVFPSQDIETLKQEEGAKIKMIVSGWGLTESGKSADILQLTAISYPGASSCEQSYRTYTLREVKIYDNQLVSYNL